MFELHIADTDITTGTIPVSWCVSKPFLKALEDDGVFDPHVVLVIRPVDGHLHRRYEERKIVPLKDMMSYVNFRHPGENEIYGYIPFGPYSSIKRLKKRLGGEYEDTIDSDEMSRGNWGHVWRIVNNGRLENKFNLNLDKCDSRIIVNVPKECFAPEPAEWEKRWVNLFHREQAVDQCHFRKRRLFAYSIQPLIVFVAAIIHYVFRTILLLTAVLVGARGVKEHWKKVFEYSFDNIPDFGTKLFKKGSIFIRTSSLGKHPPKNLPTFLWRLVKFLAPITLMPAFLLPVVTLAIVNPVAILGLGIAVFAIVVTFIILVLAKKYLEGSWFNLKRQAPGPTWSDDQVRLLVCDGSNKFKTAADIPQKYRSIRLRFEDLKSKVCRPFSG